MNRSHAQLGAAPLKMVLPSLLLVAGITLFDRYVHPVGETHVAITHVVTALTIAAMLALAAAPVIEAIATCLIAWRRREAEFGLAGFTDAVRASVASRYALAI